MQVAETCESDNAVQMITHVEVTPSSGSDSVVTTRVIDELSRTGDRSFGAVGGHIIWFWPERIGRRSAGVRSW